MAQRRFLSALGVVIATALLASGCYVVPGAGGRLLVLDPRPAPTHVAQWTQFEAGLTVSPRPSNPFDPKEIDVEAVFIDPSGVVSRAIGFWYQDYTRALVNGREQLTPRGDPYFAVRFTPSRAGTWTWSWEVTTPKGRRNTVPRRLRVEPHDDPGFVRRSPTDARYLDFDNGAPYFAVGENTGWYDKGGTYDYDNWFGSLAAQHANFARVWMPSWAFGIEWNDTGLGDYTNRLPNAWQLDHVFDDAQADGIYVELSLLNHGAFSTVFNSEWADNPYNAANGGPLAKPADFFTNAAARQLFEQRLRYIVARWGSSTHLLAWELWNEVDLTDGYNANTVAAWHQTMAEYLHSIDPYRHLITTSDAIFPNSPEVWSVAGLDFTQLHFYTNPIGWFPNLSQDVVSFTGNRLAAARKPVLFAELGVNSDGAAQTQADDPGGIGVHDGLWAGVVSQGFGTAMTWWWDTLIDPGGDRYYPMIGSVARFVEGIPWDHEQFTPLHATVSTAMSRPLVSYGLGGSTVSLLWIKDNGYQFSTPQRVDISDATVSLHTAGTGSWCGNWFDTWTGTNLASATFAAGDATLTVPEFHGDIALRVHSCGA